MAKAFAPNRQHPSMAAASGAAVGILGGLIGLGGAEFRLPILIGLFGFPALEAVILNKATSLVVVASGLIFRAQAVPLALVAGQWSVMATLLAGSPSLAISLPTMLVGFARYSRDQSFGVLRANRRFVLVLAAGSIAGVAIGSYLVRIVPTAAILPLLATILLLSAVKVWRHR